jgi:hypothetical protein
MSSSCGSFYYQVAVAFGIPLIKSSTQKRRREEEDHIDPSNKAGPSRAPVHGDARGRAKDEPQYHHQEAPFFSKSAEHKANKKSARTQKNAGRTGSRFQNVHLVKEINVRN